MSRTVQTEVYKFNELSKPAKKKALQWGEDLNTAYNWWENIEEDAKIVGVLFDDFSIYSGTIKGSFDSNAYESCQRILLTHGCKTETFKNALYYKEFLDKDEENEFVSSVFLNKILKDYFNLLRREFEYLTSEAAIIEAIEANDYEFYLDGSIFIQK